MSHDSPPGIDVSPEQWAIVRDILLRCIPGHEVRAFGSRTTHAAKAFSDLDLAVITTEPMGLDVRALLADAFSESDLPWKVDIVDWSVTSDEFREIINRNYVVVQPA